MTSTDNGLADRAAYMLNAPPGALRYINHGSFGVVHMYDFQRMVYKTVLYAGHGAELEREYQLYTEVESAGARGSPGGFMIPRAWQMVRPSIQEGAGTSAWELFDKPTFALDLIPSLPPAVAQTYSDLFFSAELKREKPPIRMLRLYLGREDLPPTTMQMHPGIHSDFPLDLRRYSHLREELTRRASGIAMPTVQDISRGMGDVLARLHWLAGINARDVELVLAGGDWHPRCWAFDLNQCQRWLRPFALRDQFDDPRCSDPNLTTDSYANDSLASGCERLATLISTQELYYPRPHQGEVYLHFRDGYLDEVDVILAGMSGGEQGVSAEWQDIMGSIRQAARCFFERYEALDEEKQERLHRRRVP